MNSGRFLHTGLTPHPVDLWAINAYNEGIARSRDDYNRHMARKPFGPRSTPCARCQRPTLHATGYCWACRRTITHRQNSPWRQCEGAAGRTCTTRTIHQSGLCYDCLKYTNTQNRAVEGWYVCKRPGCGRATQNAALVCTRCKSGKIPNGPSMHWSLRFRPQG